MEKKRQSATCVLILALLHLLARATCSGSVGSTERAPEDRLPVALRKQIQELVPSGHIVLPRDVTVESCGPKSDPGVVIGDFNGDGRNDYAILLRSDAPTSRKEGAFAELSLVIFLDLEGRWQRVFMNRFRVAEGLASRHVITLQPPATLQESDGPRKVSLKHPGIAWVYCEAGVRVYYWSPRKGAFDSIVTSG
jgi:hypothetical protein